MLDVNVLRYVRSHGVVGELDCSVVVFINCYGTVLLLVDILHQLPKVHSTFPGVADRYVFGFSGEENNYLFLF
jgi:hypothetical protein